MMMKYICGFSMLLLFITQIGVGQDTLSVINSNWTNLKSQLQRRTNIVDELSVVLSKSLKVNMEELKKTKSLSDELYILLDSLKPNDSSTISLASTQNNKLSDALSRTFVSLESDSQFRSREDVSGLMTQLEGCENRIALAKKDYNDVCETYGQRHLFFDKKPAKKTTGIKF